MTSSIEDITVETVRDAHRLVEYYYEQGWTDGLPVVPPIPETVQSFLEYTGRDGAEVIIDAPHLDRRCTVELAAINAIMAGCLKEHFPVVLATAQIFEGRLPLMQSTTGQAQFICVNGPIRKELGFNSGAGVLGPGFRANATVSRAIRLIIMNALGIRPHEFDQGTQGTPAKYGFCIAENEEESPWAPLHVDRGFDGGTSTVTAQFARACLHVDNRSAQQAEQVLDIIAESMSYPGHFMRGWGRSCTLVLGPTHAQFLADRGWSKAEVQRYLWERFGRTLGELRSWGEYNREVIQSPFEGAYSDGPDEEFLRWAETPDWITVVVAGAANGGVSSIVTHFSPALDTRAIDNPAQRSGAERERADVWTAGSR
jgi:hypothetical protein